MKSAFRAVSRCPLYPWLLTLFPILHLYATNLGSVKDAEVIIVAVYALAAVTVAFLLCQVALGDRHRSALVVSVLSLAFSLSGHIHGAAFPQEPLLVWTAGVMIAAALAARETLARTRSDSLQSAAPWLNLICLLLALAQVPAIASYHFQDSLEIATFVRASDASVDGAPQAKLLDSPSLPDIYYIIPDGYPSDSWLLSAMGFDNSAFTEALQARGFQVAPHAQSNYGGTLASLASTLNMRLFDHNPTELKDVDYLRLAIANNQVARFLQGIGYSYIQFMSGYLFPSSIAEINRDFAAGGPVDIHIRGDNLSDLLTETAGGTTSRTSLKEFYLQSFADHYLESTLLKLFAGRFEDWLTSIRDEPYGMYSPLRFLDTLDEVPSLVVMPEATFSLIHLIKPHRPATFDENGNIIGRIGEPTTAEHLAELRFINRRFLELIDLILERSKHPPVIIFQADHGSTNGSVRAQDRRLIHFEPYVAFYVPPVFELEIPYPHTNVNTFPLILNTLFDAGIAFSENRLFEVSTSTSRPLDQTDVTETFARWLQ